MYTLQTSNYTRESALNRHSFLWVACLKLFGIVLLVTLVTSQGCTRTTNNEKARTTFGTLRDLKEMVVSKSQKEVVAVIGKPDYIQTYGDSHDMGDDEVWLYYNSLRHPVTDQPLHAHVHFAKGVCIAVTD